jgi:FAD/FMN-containing dehydrogenase
MSAPHASHTVRRRSVLASGSLGLGVGVLAAATPAAAAPTGLETLTGRVLLPGDDGYTEASQGWNRSLPSSPALVVEAADAADVAAAIRWAAAEGVPVGVMATGHQPSVPTDGGLLLSTRRMNGVRVDRDQRSVVVGPGATWGSAAPVIADAGLVALAGSAGTVGVTGYTLGGGVSPVLGRALGWAADHVRRLEVVTADGCHRTVTAESEPDLFWGMRGAKGNFGVVTELEFSAFDAVPLYAGALAFALADAPKVLRTWRDWARTVPGSVSTSAVLVQLPPAPELPEPLRGNTVVMLRVCAATDEDEGRRLVEPLRRAAPVLLDAVAPLPFANFAAIHSDPVDPSFAVERNGTLDVLADDVLDVAIDTIGRPDRPGASILEFRRLGGALAELPEVPNAVGGREAQWTMLAITLTTPADQDAAEARLDTFTERVDPWLRPDRLANFQSHDDASRGLARVAFDDDTWARLRCLKREVDPDNLFRLNFNVPPASRP